MTRKIKLKLILQLHEQGMSLNEISRSILHVKLRLIPRCIQDQATCP